MIHRLLLVVAGATAIAAFVVACVGDDPAPSSGDPDAAPDGPGLLDSGTDTSSDARPTGPCDLAAPWPTPVVLTSVSSPDNEQRPSLSPDELTIYFSSRRPIAGDDAGASRIFAATRTAKTTDTFTTPTPISLTVNRPGYDTVGSSLSNDSRRLYFSAKTAGTPNVIYEAARAGGTSTTGWDGAIVTAIGDLDAGVSEFSPFINSDGTLYFARSGAPINYELFRADPVSSGFKPAVVIGELTSPQDDSDPLVSADGLTIYFSSVRPPSVDADIWVATRTAITTGFGPPSRVVELSSDGHDVPGWLSADGCRMYILSSRSGGPGGLDIYLSSRPLL